MATFAATIRASIARLSSAPPPSDDPSQPLRRALTLVLFSALFGLTLAHGAVLDARIGVGIGLASLIVTVRSGRVARGVVLASAGVLAVSPSWPMALGTLTGLLAALLLEDSPHNTPGGSANGPSAPA
jgi:hypothetical protein